MSEESQATATEDGGDPFATLDADIAQLKKEATQPADAAPRDASGKFVAQEPEPEPAEETQDAEPAEEGVAADANWEDRYKELEGSTATQRQQVQAWFQQHFPSQERWEQFQKWTQHEKSVQKTQQQTQDSAAMPDAAEEEDIFETVENLKKWKADAEQKLGNISNHQQAEEEKFWVKKTQSEAEALAKKYPAVASNEGREMMFAITLSNMDRGGTMEGAAKQIQALAGGGAIEQPPAQEPAPTAIRKGKSRPNPKGENEDEREESWYSGAMNAFDLIAKDTKNEFGITH